MNRHATIETSIFPTLRGRVVQAFPTKVVNVRIVRHGTHVVGISKTGNILCSNIPPHGTFGIGYPKTLTAIANAAAKCDIITLKEYHYGVARLEYVQKEFRSKQNLAYHMKMLAKEGLLTKTQETKLARIEKEIQVTHDSLK